MNLLAFWLPNSITAEDLRFYFVIFVLFAIAIAKALHIAWRLGRRSILRERFSATLRPDDSVRQRL